MMSPAPEQPVPIYVGGLSEPGLRARGAPRRRLDLGAEHRGRDHRTRVERAARRYRAEYGRCRRARSRSTRCCIDAFDLDGYRRLADAGVTELQSVPWYFTGKDPETCGNRIDSLAWFADTIIGQVRMTGTSWRRTRSRRSPTRSSGGSHDRQSNRRAESHRFSCVLRTNSGGGRDRRPGRGDRAGRGVAGEFAETTDVVVVGWASPAPAPPSPRPRPARTCSRSSGASPRAARRRSRAA